MFIFLMIYPGAVKRFLRRMQPAIAVIMETEIWPNILLQCKARQIPVLFANVRLSRKSARGYQRVRRFFTEPLRAVAAFAVQSQPDAERLRALGAVSQSVHVTGSIKFEVSFTGQFKRSSATYSSRMGRKSQHCRGRQHAQRRGRNHSRCL